MRLLPPRAVMIAFAVALGALVVVWSRRLYGWRAAVAAAFVGLQVAGDDRPGHLVTLDLPGALGFAATAFAVWRLLDRPAPSAAAIAGATLGVASLLKLSGFILIGAVVVVVAVRAAAERDVRATQWAKLLCLLVLAAVAVINAGYLFRGTFAPLTAANLAPNGPLAHLRDAAPWLRFPLPLPFVNGIDMVMNTGKEHEPSYFLAGELSSDGWWYYHLAAFAAKCPLPVLLAGIGATVALSLVDLRLAIVTGGAGAILTAAALAIVMPERRPSIGVGIDRTARRTFVAGVSMVRGSGTVLALIAAAAVAGAFSEGFDRLSTPHLLDVGLPAAGGLEPVVWFGLLALGGNVSGLTIATALRRVADPERRRSLGLIALWSGTIVTVTLFAAAPGFWLAAGALLVAGPLRSLATPLWMGWISDRSDAGTRATVLSFAGQADCLGQVSCGPLVGLVAVTFSIEFALVASAFLLVPSVILVAATSGLLARLVREGTRRTPEMPRSALHYRLLHRGDRAVLQVAGVINEQTCPRLVAAIDQVYQRRVAHLVMDIARVDPLDEEARRCLLECEHRAHFLNIRFELQPRTAIAATSAS